MKTYVIIFLLAILAAHDLCGADTYTNPVIDINLPDPTVICDDNGVFYMTGTGNWTRKWAEDEIANLTIYRSSDLVNWTEAGKVFDRDRDHPDVNQIWAPEFCRINGKYVLFYCANPDDSNTCLAYTGYAVADNILGPWEDRGKLIDGYMTDSQNTIDPFYFHDDDGKHYLFWGSTTNMWAMEIFVDDNLNITFDLARKRQTAGFNIEGTEIYKRNGYYYLFGSIDSYAWIWYQIVVGRSNNIFGPYYTKEGINLLTGGSGESPYNDWNLKKAAPLTANNSTFTGMGHNAPVITDGVGNTWLICHAHKGQNVEPLCRVPLLGRLKWTDDGWPYLDSGTMPDSPQTAPYFPGYNASRAENGVETTFPLMEQGGTYDVFLMGDKGIDRLKSLHGVTVNDYRKHIAGTHHAIEANTWWAPGELTDPVPATPDGRDLLSFLIHGDWKHYWGGVYVKRTVATDFSHLNPDSRLHIAFYPVGTVRPGYIELHWFKNNGSDPGCPTIVLAETPQAGHTPVVGALQNGQWTAYDISLGKVAELMAKNGKTMDYSRFTDQWQGEVLEVSPPSGQEGDSPSEANGHGAAACFDCMYVYTPEKKTLASAEKPLGSKLEVKIASGFLTVDGHDGSPVELYAMDGRLMGRSATATMDIDSIPSGIYMVKACGMARKVIIDKTGKI